MRPLATCFIGLLLLSAGCSTTPRTTTDFASVSISRPEFFPIMPWNSYDEGKTNAPSGFSGGLDTVAKCNFTIGGFSLAKDVGNFEKLGLGALVYAPCTAAGRDWDLLDAAEIGRQIKITVDAAGRNPAMVGFMLKDEPSVTNFPALAKAVAAVKKYAPGKLAYVNLFPDYATLGAPDNSQLGAKTYTEYLERFVSEVQPQLLSYDNYMIQYSQDQANPGVAASYYKNMLEVRRVAQEHNLPFINIAGSNQINPDSTPPSPANLMFQAYTTLAAGSRGIIWFTYYRGGFNYAPVDENKRETPVWPWLKEVNREVITLAPILSRLTSTGVFFSSPAPTEGLPLLPGKDVESVTCPTPLMIGEFQGTNGQPYVMVVNLSMEKSAKFQIKTTASYGKICVISAQDGTMEPFNVKDGLWLTAGQGVLLALDK